MAQVATSHPSTVGKQLPASVSKSLLLTANAFWKVAETLDSSPGYHTASGPQGAQNSILGWALQAGPPSLSWTVARRHFCVPVHMAKYDRDFWVLGSLGEQWCGVWPVVNPSRLVLPAIAVGDTERTAPGFGMRGPVRGSYDYGLL